MQLLIDIGNQRLKWLTRRQLLGQTGYSNLAHQVINADFLVMKERLLKSFSRIEYCQTVWVSCVSGSETLQVVKEVCHALWAIQPQLAKVTLRCAGLVNQYKTPYKLGVDRWLAALAAWQRAKGRPILVIDAGTAVTLDFIDPAGNFKGGLIAPGLSVMIQSLSNNAHNINMITNYIDKMSVNYMNDNTQDCVHYGALVALFSVVDNVIAFHQIKWGDDLVVFVTGGDGKIISNLSKEEIIIDPTLVLRGLEVVSQENKT